MSVYKMNLKNLYGTFLQNGNSPEAFIANIIYERYGAKRKKMLQGLYNIINGGPKYYWSPCHVTFAPFQMETIFVTAKDDNERMISGNFTGIKEVNINDLPFYA